METSREQRSGFFGVDSPLSVERRPSPIVITAGLSVCALLIAIFWSANRQISAAPPAGYTPNAPEVAPHPVPSFAVAGQEASTSPDLSNFAPQVMGFLASQYQTLAQKGESPSQAGTDLAAQLGPVVKAPVQYHTYSIADIQISPDTSYARMQQYQKDLRIALAPFSKNTTPEISIFALYSETHETKYLDQLRAVAREYEDAVQNTSAVAVPSDAGAIHAGILNAMGEFGAILRALADNANDPITVVGLLNAYNDAEYQMVVSFNSLASYVANHPKP